MERDLSVGKPGTRRKVSRRELLGAAAVALLLAALAALSACAAPSAAPTSAPTVAASKTAPTAPTAAPAAPATAAPAAPTAAGASGQFKGTIKFGQLQDLSGTGAVASGEMFGGWQDYFQYVNERKGGVSGYKIEMVVFDTKGDANLVRSGYKRIVETLQPPDAAQFFMTFQLSNFPFIWENANADKYLFLGTSGTPNQVFLSQADEAAGKNNYFFSTIPGAVEGIKGQFMWLSEDWKTKGKTGKPKVAMFGPDIAVGRLSEKVARITAQQLGVDFLGAVWVAAQSATDAVSQVTQMKQWGVDYVVGSNSTSATDLLLARDSARLDFKPQFVLHTTAASGAAQAKETGLIGAVTYSYTAANWSETTVPGVALARQLNAQYHPDKTSRTDLYVMGYGEAMIYEEILRRGIEKLGATKLTSDGLREIAEGLKDFQTMGLTPPVTFTHRDHRGNNGVRMLKINDKFEALPLGPALKTPTLTEEEYKVYMGN